MKRSRYTYFFEIDKEYVGYSYLSDDYAAFPMEKKECVERILKYPDEIITNIDTDIYRKLCKKNFLIRDDFDEYNFLLRLHRQFIHRTDRLMLVILPTMACNCRCTYCYELHPSLKKSKMSREVIDNLKKYISDKIKSIKMLNMGWFGGEPLLCMDIIKEISEFSLNLCDKENVSYIANMSSNGVLLNKNNAQIITDCKIHNVQITLDGSKENHNKTRVTVNGKSTFDIIHSNIINYLDINNINKITLRIHVYHNAKNGDIKEIIETLKIFEEKYRPRIFAYPHVIFAASSEKWANEYYEECRIDEKETTQDILVDITTKIYEEAVELGFASMYKLKRRRVITCEADIDNYWAIRPDGYLSKCTVGIEKERAQAKLTKNGIELFPERFFKAIKKEFSTKLHKYCQDCEYLPFCWQGCIYKHYQHPDVGKFIKTKCQKGKINWIIKRMMNDLKYEYIKEKRER